MERKNTTRRDFIFTSAAAALTGTAALSAAGCSAQKTEKEGARKNHFPKGSVILFQGDSITDMHRNRKKLNPNNVKGMGYGYPAHISGYLLAEEIQQEYKIYNRGVSGNKVFQLAERWQEDCLDIKPDVLSILIGVNDIWHKLKGRYPEGSAEKYESDYDVLLKRTKDALPNVKIIICEPFTLKVGAVNDDWFPEFDAYRAAAKKMADKYADIFVPFQAMFNKALEKAPAAYWLPDGVHPSIAGAYIMAQEWLKYTL